MAGFHLTLFGIPELRDADGGVVPLRTQKQLALLVYLAFEARVRPASRDAVVDLLWSDAPEPKARHSASQALSAIRGALGLSSVQCVRDSIKLEAPLTTDLELERLSDVAGDIATPLRDLDRCAGADFAQWVDNIRVRCLKYVRDSLTRDVERARASGDVGAVHEQAISLYAVDPGSDVAAHVLAERELLRGDASQAIRFLRKHLARAERDLSRAPTGLKRLLRRIENGGTSAPAQSESTAFLIKAPEEAFVGREAELVELERAWAEARKGAFVGCLVTGDTGIGKSSLVRRFATSITARGAPVLLASCQEIGSAIPFAVVSDLIHELVREPGLNATDPAWLSEASRVYPALRSRFPGVPEPPTVPGESIRLRVAEALFHMIEAIADVAPVLMVLDDVPHTDPASFETLHALTRRLDRTAFLLLGTGRTATFGSPGGASDSLGPATWARTLNVAPLPAAETMRLVSLLFSDGPEPDERVRNEIVDLASGNPYFAEMLVNDWKKHSRASLAATRAAGELPPEGWQPPDTLRLAFARQSAKLAPDVREILNMLAVAGRAMMPAEAADLLGWDASKVDRAILALLEDGVVRFDQGRVGFKNELHRAYVYYAMPVDLRRYDHGKIGSALMRYTGTHKYQTALHAAFHFLRAAMAAEATHAVVSGAAEAIAHGAPGEAEQAILAILDHVRDGGRQKLNLLLAQATAAQGRYGEALSILNKWRPQSPDPEEAAVAARMEAELRLKSGHDADEPHLVGAVRRAVAAARLARNPRLVALALQVQAEAAAEIGDAKTLSRVGRTAARIAANADQPEARAFAEAARSYCLMTAGDLEAAELAFSSSAHHLAALQLDSDLMRVLNGIGMCSTGLGRVEQAIAAFRQAILIAERTGNAHFRGNTWTNLAVVLRQIGCWREACDCVVTAAQHASRSTIPLTAAMLYTNAAILALALGAVGQAEEMLAVAEAATLKGTSWVAKTEVLLDRATLHLSKGEEELAWPLIEAAETTLRARGGPPGRLGSREALLRHWTLATLGYGALKDLARRRKQTVLGLGLAERLHVQAFDEWADLRAGERPNGAALRSLKSAGLYGVLAHLVAIKTPPPLMPEPESGESSAMLIARLFPDPARGTPPAEIPLRR